MQVRHLPESKQLSCSTVVVRDHQCGLSGRQLVQPREVVLEALGLALQRVQRLLCPSPLRELGLHPPISGCHVIRHQVLQKQAPVVRVLLPVGRERPRRAGSAYLQSPG